MYYCVNPADAKVLVTSDVKRVQEAISNDWHVYREGKRIW